MKLFFLSKHDFFLIRFELRLDVIETSCIQKVPVDFMKFCENVKLFPDKVGTQSLASTSSVNISHGDYSGEGQFAPPPFAPAGRG